MTTYIESQQEADMKVKDAVSKDSTILVAEISTAKNVQSFADKRIP